MKKEHEQQDRSIINDKTKGLRDGARKNSESSKRSTIDEEIAALIEWKKKYPDIIIEIKNSSQPISEKIIKKLKEIAQKEGIEFSDIKERYKKIRNYNYYLRKRENTGKLTEEQRDSCKEGNLRGRFGFPKEIEELANKLKIDIEKVSETITSYGSVDNFLQMYRDGKLTDEQVIWYNNNLINNMIDMDNNPLSKNYSNLLRAIFGMQKLDKNNLMLFSSKKLEESFEILTPREMFIIQNRFGLIDGKDKTIEVVGKELNFVNDRVRRIEAKGLRKLKHPSRVNQFKPIIINDLKENEYVTDEERNALTDLESYIWNSNLIFKYGSIDDVDFDKEKFDVIRNIQEKLNLSKNEAKKSESEIEDIRNKKSELEAKLKLLEEQVKQAKELLADYNKIIGDDKVNADDETLDFKDE